MPITVNIDNGSKFAVSEVSAKMTQLSHFHASHGNMIGVTAHTHNRNDEKLVAESRRVADVPAKSRGQMVLSMKIPAIVPSFNCPIIAVDYCLTVKVSTQQIFGGGLKCEFPLIIGTIPIRQMNQAGNFFLNFNGISSIFQLLEQCQLCHRSPLLHIL